jgi:hypothetical protein
MIDEDTARAEYAKWFVKEHFLRRNFSVDWGAIAAWKRAQERGEVRFKMVRYPWSTESSIYDEYWFYTGFYVGGRKGPEVVDSAVPLEDLDSPRHDDRNIVVLTVRRGREEEKREKVQSWLMEEAEYNRVYYEALVRSYGVEVTAP